MWCIVYCKGQSLFTFITNKMHNNQFTQMTFVNNYISAGQGNKVAGVSWAVQRDQNRNAVSANFKCKPLNWL